MKEMEFDVGWPQPARSGTGKEARSRKARSGRLFIGFLGE
jgi:hypothetical protein